MWRIRQQIQDGTYPTPEAIDGAAERLAHDIDPPYDDDHCGPIRGAMTVLAIRIAEVLP